MELIESKTAFLFPGQGSQQIGMGLDLASAFPVAKKIYEQADSMLGFSLSNIAWHGPLDYLNDTINTQPALLIHSIAVLQVLKEKMSDFKPRMVAGHSMGELSAIVASDSIPFKEALNLVRKRGTFMKKAGETNPGGMAAILGLDLFTVEDICNDASGDGEIVQVANDNCPGQVVISGARRALEKSLQLAEKAGAKKVIKLAVSIAAHSPLMVDAQSDFNEAVDEAPISDPKVSIIGNVCAAPLSTGAEIITDLKSQLNSRVRWHESINFMVSQGIDTFIEIGSGSVLTGLLKRINRKVTGISIGSPEDFEKIESSF
ncbi:MAG: ACP S-malonyltransferase [Anaerolineales bacterium]|jgi:[acyl-carrier-protein] S-malonyltransferase